MRQRSNRTRFTLEPRKPLAIGDTLVRQDLDCYFASKSFVARSVDLAHAARADRRDDFIPARGGCLKADLRLRRRAQRFELRP